MAGKAGFFSFNGIGIDNGANAFIFNSVSNSITVNGNSNNINGNVPTATLAPSGTSLQPGQTETYTITVFGGTGPFAVSLFNVTGSAIQGSPLNAIIALPGGSNTISFTASNPGTFAYNATVSDMGTRPSAFVFNSVNSQITVTQPTTTTISNGGGGGGGGGIIGSGGGVIGGGSSKPVIFSSGEGCIGADNVTIPNSFAFNLSNSAFNVTDNYIGSNYTSVIVNGVTYVLNLNVPTPINGTPIYMALKSVSYLPILHTVDMVACPSQSKQVSSISVYANLSSSTFSVTKVVPSYLSNNVTFVGTSNVPALSNGYFGLFVGSLAVDSGMVKTANVTISYPCGIASGPPEPYLLLNGTWTGIAAALSTNASACSISFDAPSQSTIALLSKLKAPVQAQPAAAAKPKQGVIMDMFILPNKQFSWTAAILGLGLAAVSTTKLRKKLPRSRQPQHRQGNSNKAIRLIERLAIIEILIFAAMVVLFVFRHILLSMIAAFGFGIVLAYFVDRIIAARRPNYVYAYKRKHGIRKLVEEVGIIEMALFVASAWAYVARHTLLGIALAFLLGLALSYFIDRIRQVRKTESAAKQGSAAEAGSAPAPLAAAWPKEDAAPTASTMPTGTASVYAAPMGVTPADAVPDTGAGSSGEASAHDNNTYAAPIETALADAEPAPDSTLIS